MKTGGASHAIDDLMDRASAALLRTDYFGAERLCCRALERAAASADWERAARVCLPLQEARRQKRLRAIDASAGVRVISTLQEAQEASRATGEAAAGCYLFQPPLIALDARRFREAAESKEIPVFVLAREPMTRAGQWPVAAVAGPLSVRARVQPPAGVRPAPDGMSPQCPTGDERVEPISIEWFIAAAEALGDAAIAKANPADPSAHRALDLMDFLDAFPDHEKLHQRLEEACRAAAVEPAPAFPRRRPMVNDPYSF